MKRSSKIFRDTCDSRGNRAGACGALAAGAFALAASIVVGVAPAHAFPWSIDMFRGAAVQPLSVPPRVMPAGVLPVDGIHYDIHPGQPANLPGINEQALPEMKLETMTVKLHNPLQPTPPNLAHGRELFLSNCSPCHGVSGEGNGPVVHLLAHKPANLMTGVSKNLPDGYIYGYIRNGGIWMPSYDDAMNSTERWQVVMYLRDLEQNYHPEQAGATPADASASGAASGADASAASGMNMAR